jgi:hypothetical protein
MREIDRVHKSFNTYPDHDEVETSRKDIKMAACPDCGCEVFTLRVIKREFTYPENPALDINETKFFANCIYCDHQIILGKFDWNEEEHQ